MYKQNDEQTLSIQTNLTLGELETKSRTAFMSNKNLACYTSLHSQNLLRTQIFIDCGLLHLILTIFFSVISTYLALYQYRQRHCTEQSVLCYAVSILIFDGLRLSGIERSNYLKTNNLGRKKLSRIRNREDPVCYHNVFYHIKNRREKFGTDEIVRFRGDSGIEKIRFRGFYCTPI